jgi:hypothetical protein
MKFNTAAFDRHLKNMGQRVLWRRSFGCACVNPVSGAPDPKHLLCAGKGRIWDAPQETVTGIARQETVAEWAQSGLWESGDMVLSIPQSSPLWDAGMFDRVTMLNSNDVFSQPLIRGAPTEKLVFTPETITRVFWLHPTTRLIVEGGIPTIGANGIPVWTEGEPPAGTSYSMTGTKYSEYFLFDKFPSNRNVHSGMRLPKRVVARKWDLFGR